MLFESSRFWNLRYAVSAGWAKTITALSIFYTKNFARLNVYHAPVEGSTIFL